MTFAVDSQELSSQLAVPVYTLGIHSGMGMEYIIETAKKIANEGDTILFSFIPYEANQYGMDLIFLSLNGEPDMFLEFFKKHPTEVVKSMGAATVTKLYGIKDYIKKRDIEAENVYDARSFDRNNGNLIYKRDACVREKDYLQKFKGNLNVDAIDDECFVDVIDLATYCENQNIKFDIMYAPFYTGYYGEVTKGELQKYQQELENKLKFKFIVDISECEVPMGYIYDEALHLNDNGKKYYTDLMSYGIRNILD